MMERFSFSRFCDLLKPFVGKLVAVEVEGYILTGKIACFGEQNNILLMNRKKATMVRGTWTAIKLLELKK